MKETQYTVYNQDGEEVDTVWALSLNEAKSKVRELYQSDKMTVQAV